MYTIVLILTILIILFYFWLLASAELSGRPKRRAAEVQALSRQVLMNVMGLLSEADGGLSKSGTRGFLATIKDGSGKHFRAGTRPDFDLDAALDLIKPHTAEHQGLICSWCWFSCTNGRLSPARRRILDRCGKRLSVRSALVDEVCTRLLENVAGPRTSPSHIKATVPIREIIFKVLGHIATADGRVLENMVADALELPDGLELPGTAGRSDETHFRAGMEADFNLDVMLGGVMPLVETRQATLRTWCAFACTHGELTPARQQILEHCCDRFDLPHSFIRKVCTEYQED